MELLKKKIIEEGRTNGQDIVKVDSFLNHQMDISLLNEIGKEFKRRFEGEEITKILTIEASGIGIACIAAQYFNVPVLFAKKAESRNLDTEVAEVYESKVFSFTKSKNCVIRVSKKYLNKDDKILIIDDFLANGDAVIGLMDLIIQANAQLTGVGIVIEKGFQNGGKIIRDANVHLESLAIIESIENNRIIFHDEKKGENNK